MAGTQQPPIGNWPPAPGGPAGPAQPGYGPGLAQPGYGQGPAQPGYGPGPAQPGYGPGPAQPGYGPGPGQAGFGPGPAQPGFGPGPAQPGFAPAQPGFAPAQPGYTPVAGSRPRRRRPMLVIGGVVVFVIVAVIAGVVVASHPKGGLSLPGKLLGLSKATSADARHLAVRLKGEESSGGKGRLKNVVAAVYGSPAGTGIAVSGGGICGTCTAKSPSVVRGNLAGSGYADAASFPGGTKGGTVACGSKSGLIRCTWVDSGTAGDILFAGSSASGLADAAAKTNQIRSVIEH